MYTNLTMLQREVAARQADARRQADLSRAARLAALAGSRPDRAPPGHRRRRRRRWLIGWL